MSYLVLFSLLWLPTFSFAEEVPGPVVWTERVSPAPMTHTRGADTSDKITRDRTGFNGMVPIPATLFGGMVIGKVDVVDEVRHVIGSDGPHSSSVYGLGRSTLVGTGIVFLPHAQEGAPRHFFAAERFSEARHPKETPVMWQGDIGLVLAGPDMPVNVRFSPTDQTTTTLLLEGRKYPGLNTFMFVIGHRIKQQTGFFLDMAMPVLLQVGYESPSRLFDVYGGIRIDSRFASYFEGPLKGYWDGESESRHLGGRVRLIAPLYLGLEAGYQKENMRSLNLEGEEISAHQSRLVPWARVSLETRFQNP